MKLKTILLAPLLLTLSSLTFYSCDSQENISQLEAEEAVELVQASMQAQTGGWEELIELLIEKVDSLDIDITCDSLHADTFSYSYQGPRFQCDYNTDWTIMLSCNRFSAPQEGDFTFYSTGTYSTSKISSEDEVTFTGNMAGLEFTKPNFILEGSYQRDGSQVITRQRSGNPSTTTSINSLLDIQLDSLSINKYTNQGIASGIGIISLTGDVSGSTFSYTGDIVFHGNKTASLTLNGTSYSIDWN
ncbi:MAG: hypothetical protein MRZ79_15115 [Bacteroidia bacterium]|nr:hypothetical protein [Bacteroidia bacterium]